jgi:ornithine cyclodeaminase/alanine dehydrogenase-like protein (mu-crystallin family)
MALFDADRGVLLAPMDSSVITSRRTAAATAVAAKFLALANPGAVTICGCGEQGRAYATGATVWPQNRQRVALARMRSAQYGQSRSCRVSAACAVGMEAGMGAITILLEISV